ncbi:YibE/F family protein [Georgenia halophila]|uniref:YibE/F family protein n=1 Tax=Georgenia halophila TaxID=620889 RepID=A0ABP8LQQ1_9MICO
MPDGHSGHSHDLTLPRGEARRTRWILAALVVPLLVATVVGLAALWPRGETPIGSVPLAGTGMTIEHGTVTEVIGVDGGDLDGGDLDGGGAQPPGDAAQDAGGQVRVELSTGVGEGQVVPVQVPPEVLANGIGVGDEIRLMFSAQAMGTGSPYVFWDFERKAPIGWLALGYALVVLAVARWRGLAAMAGLTGSLGIIVAFVIPAIMLGSPPVLVTLVGCSAMMFMSLYLAHGISIRTTTALLGTFVGLFITVLLATWGTRSANLTGSSSDSALMLMSQFENLSLMDLLLCGMVIAGLGVLNDVTITQASAVWELHAADPSTPKRTLMRRGMRIGRDHIASTVYTLAFAYVGTSLPVLMMAALMDRTMIDTLMAAEIAEEIVRTLVASIGLVLAIPATTGIGVALVRTSRRRSDGSHTAPGLTGEPEPATMAR